MAKEKGKTNITRIKAGEPKTSKPKQKPVKSTKPANSGSAKKSTKPATSTVTKKSVRSTKPATSSAAKKPAAVDKTKAAVNDATGKRKNILVGIKDYFVGAWYELRQVRWPDRKATWSMTGALLVFTTIFVTLILLIDSLFKYLFQLIIV